MAPIKDAQADAVELVVVFAAQPLAALVVLPNPAFEALLDLVHLVPRAFGLLRIDNPRVGLRIGVIHGRRFEIQCVLNQLDRRIPRRAPFRRVRYRAARREVCFYKPGANRRRVLHRDSFVAEKHPRESLNIRRRNPHRAQTRINLGCAQVSGLNRFQGGHIFPILCVCLRRGPCVHQLRAHVARQVFVIGFPLLALRIPINHSL